MKGDAALQGLTQNINNTICHSEFIQAEEGKMVKCTQRMEKDRSHF